MGSRIVVTVLLAWCLFLPGCSTEVQSPAEETGWEFWEGRRPGEHGPIEVDSRIWAGQVVDRVTGAPIPACRVRVYSEIGKVVLDGEGTLIGEAVSDEDGFVLMRVGLDPKPSHWVYEADGYAPQTDTFHEWPVEADDAVARLSRGTSCRGRVVDPLGRPCRGVRVSSYQGCRHAPALRRAVTDGEGRFSFDQVLDGPIWIEGPGIASAYCNGPRAGQDDDLVFSKPGITASGRVTNLKGEPLPGIWVRGPWSRGPAVRTDADGCFKLKGLTAGMRIGLATDTLPEDMGVVTSTPSSLVVPDPRPFHLIFDVEDASIPKDRQVRMVILDLPGGPGWNQVTMINRETGQAYVKEFEGPEGTIEVPAGPYEVRVGGPLAVMWLVPFDEDYQTSCPLLKPKPYAAYHRVALRIEYEGASPEGEPDEGQDPLEFLEISLREPSGWVISVGQMIRDGEEILVPPNTPLALLIRDFGETPLFVPIAPVRADATEAVVRKLALPTPTSMRLAFRLSEGGYPDDLRVSLLDAHYGKLELCRPDEDDNGNLVVTYRDGRSRHLLIEHPMIDKTALLELPDALAPGRVHQLGEVRFELPRKYRAIIRNDRGRTQDGLSVAFLDHDVGLYPLEEVEEEGEGVYNHLRNRPVRLLRITGSGRLPVVEEVEGPGPFTVTLSSASVMLELPDGDATKAWGYLDGRPMHLDPSARTLSLLGVPPGMHRLKVCLPDGHHRKRVIQLEEAEARRLRF